MSELKGRENRRKRSAAEKLRIVLAGMQADANGCRKTSACPNHWSRCFPLGAGESPGEAFKNERVLGLEVGLFDNAIPPEIVKRHPFDLASIIK